MSLKDSLLFHFSFSIASIPIYLSIVSFLFFSLLYKLVGIDPVAHSTFFNLQSLPSPDSKRREHGGVCPYAQSWEKHGHEFRPPGKGDCRSPCPALNVMANHGYIPRDGKNLTGTILTNALIKCYNLSWPLAAFLAWGGVLLLGQVGQLSLQDLARHNRIEHDASLIHENTFKGEEYAPTHVAEHLYHTFVAGARKAKFGVEEIARARIRREKEPGTDITAVQQEIARGEVALVLQIFGGRKFAIPLNYIEQWWKHERLPEGWRPTRKTTLLGTVYWATQIRHSMDRMKDDEKKGKKQESDVFDEKMVNVKITSKINGIAKAEDSDLEQMHRVKNIPDTPATTNGDLDSSSSSSTVYSPSPSPIRKQSIPVAVAA